MIAVEAGANCLSTSAKAADRTFTAVELSRSQRTMLFAISGIVLALLAVGRGETGSPEALQPTCPQWLQEYQKYHAENRGAQNATYIVLYCPVGQACSGVGDRVRGSLLLLRLAALYKKIILVKWDTPDPLVNYLSPNKIDWTTQGLGNDTLEALSSKQQSEFDMHLNTNTEKLYALIQRQERKDEFTNTKMVRIQTWEMPTTAINGSLDDVFILAHGALQFNRCLFKFMYQPTASLTEHANTALIDMYGHKPAAYTAWHWRIGGLVREPDLKRFVGHPGYAELQYSKMLQLLAVLSCASNRSSTTYGATLAERPLLLVTDNNVIREWVSSGGLKQAVTSELVVAHTEFGGTGNDHLNAWIDLRTLSMAECLVISHSGYSYVAQWMSNSTCIITMADCITAAAPKLQSINK